MLVEQQFLVSVEQQFLVLVDHFALALKKNNKLNLNLTLTGDLCGCYLGFNVLLGTRFDY